ncbi:SDR family oxidoreductase [Spirosoma sp. KUDC1026]|uniref:SDR family oxidoreductase n=1 Tax=Spirosoma sp. KUDC1026 TaxID=2745947 RepID=UPI00159BB17A|nr:SDR family oxidoreductase [Spirosoma sp. KUDC1026]QKZ14489.1 SDR family oxidoreductase [Spirosoma sp. KUDC1026]
MSAFSGKVVWITGASSGIGEAVALAMAQAGARLVLSARRDAELRRVATLTGLPSTAVLILPLDMTDRASFPEKADVVYQRFGQIDYLFLNAGITQRGPVAETDFSVYERLMDVNFFGVVALTKIVLPLMLARKSGHMVVTSSVAGKLGTKERSGYCASKHALHGFFDALRAETYASGVRVTLVCPGYIRTPISLHALNAHGESHGKMDENQEKGMLPETFAHKLLRAVSQNREEVYIGGLETYGIYLKRFFPGLLSRIVRNRRSE